MTRKRKNTRNSLKVERIKGILIKYAIAIAVGVGMVLIVLYGNDFFEATDLVTKYRLLTDAFTIPGVSYILLTGLVFVSTQGFFDMISFGLGKFAKALIPFSKKSEETFYDYKTRKNEERLTGYSFLLYTGIAFMAVALVFMALFFKVYK